MSPYISKEMMPDRGNFGGESTVEVKKFIESAGFDYTSEYKGLPDHISVEWEFM